ncbi:MAG: antitoxin MazE family protein [Micrococcales bacterium]|nr:antitoxin MazE family protein [Micrococcales bacterium]
MTTTRERVAAHRARMHERGYREVRVWVPDARTEAFAARAREACLAMNRADADDDVARFLAATGTWDEEEW